MRNICRIVFVVTTLLVCFSSCDKKLQYLGYTYWGGADPKIDYTLWGHSDETHPVYSVYVDPLVFAGSGSGHYVKTRSYGRNLSKNKKFNTVDEDDPWNGKFESHAHFLLRDYNYAVFCPEGYVSENDVETLERELKVITQRSLWRMFNLMRKDTIASGLYAERFTPFLAKAINDTVNSVTLKNKFGDIGGWQILKPSVGLDEEKLDYFAVNSGDDWYEIPSPDGESSAYVKVGYAGKFLNPKIVGVKNEKFGIDIYDTNYDKRYNNKMIAFTPYDDLNCLHMYMDFLCPIVNKEIGKDRLAFQEDFVEVKKRVVEREEAFVREFYDKLLRSNNKARKVLRKYRYQMVQRFASTLDMQIKKKKKDVELFLPCSYEEFVANGYEVKYQGEDCFKVSVGGKSVYLKVVLYGKQMKPAIMGMINSSQNVDYCPDRFSWPDAVEQKL